jgi:hypothetical protein
MLTIATASAQDEHQHQTMPHTMPHTGSTNQAGSMNMNHGGSMNMTGMYLMNLASGTSQNPLSWPMPMIMVPKGSWHLMFMGNGFLSDIQQSGPRGGDKLYSTNWAMGSASHGLGSKGTFEGVLMLSLEPATITDRRYPLLFQTGETAYGMPLVDAQHPHNFVMALGFHYARQLSENAILDFYFAPVGDPAIGPPAYPHRASAMELPQAPISHHLQDSTHIANEVVTAVVKYKKFKLEASGFYGTEPGENRWTIGTGPINSWSARAWFFPTRDWAAQFSYGNIVRPEELEPGDQTRMTASVAYTRPMNGYGWSSTLVWGRTHNTATSRNLNSYLAESVLPVSPRNLLTGRFELADKDELDVLPGGTFRIGAYTAGYTRVLGKFHDVEIGVGANFTAYSLPEAIKPYYGEHPVGGNIYLRFRLK